ncbi:MAG: YlbL family protein [Segniliparus sp.]|uniref:YlbL family protein n=1 Tax=Segniliparus sp. TaxID=2804064 RepID=UPI003F325275
MTTGQHDQPVRSRTAPVLQRIVAVLVAGCAFVALLGVAGTVEVPYVALGPGPTLDLLGDGVDNEGKDTGKPVVTLVGKDADQTSGRLRLVTVSAADQLNMFQALNLWFSGDEELVPREEVYPSDKSRDQVEQENAADFSNSEEAAEAAALGELGYPLRVRVAQIVPHSPADGALRPEDWLVSVGGAETKTLEDVAKAVGSHKPGDELDIVYERAGERGSARIVLAPAENDPAKGRIGVKMRLAADSPFQVRITVPAKIGGPSGGLMFALSVIDKLTPGELTGGQDIAGTGTIEPDGKVGPIGGITHKMLGARRDGATVFLVPSENCAEAATDIPAGLRVLKVATLHDAVQELDDLKANKPVPSC